MNVFEDAVGAAAYDAGRPHFHPSVVRRFADLIDGRRLPLTLDVACGTGQSTTALSTISDVVIGLDAAVAMLQHRRRAESTRYVRGQAERLPLRDSTVDLVSVGLAVHWFDEAMFLKEAHRVLRPDCWLLVYDSGFCGRMRRNPAYGEWVSWFRQRFPAPPRGAHPPAAEFVADAGFHEVLSGDVLYVDTYDVDRLVGYLTTQSNVLFAVREGRDSHAGVVECLRASLAPILRGGIGVFEYDGWLRVYQRAG